MANSNFHLANLIGLYSGRQVRAEVNEALMALAAFMKVAGIDIDKGLEAFQAEVSRLDNAIDTDVALIDQLDKQKDCLLYTSPSPRDRTRSRMPSSA